MPRVNEYAYRKGRNFEYRVEAYFRRIGYVVIRSAGSHGPVDLVCAKGGQIECVQCKADNGYMTSAQIDGLKEVVKEFGGTAWRAFKDPKGHIKLEVL